MIDTSKWLFYDVEGNNFLPKLHTIWCISIAAWEGPVTLYADQPGYPPLKDAYKQIKECEKAVAHNHIGYDFDAVNKIKPSTLRDSQVVDSLVVSCMMEPESQHSLKSIGQRLNMHKGEHDDFSKFTPEMAEYGKQDTAILREWWKTRCHEYYENNLGPVELEHKVQYILEQQRRHGIRLDMNFLQERYSDLRQENEDITRELREIFPTVVTPRFHKTTGKPIKPHVDEFNPNSGPQVAARLIEKYGWKPTEFTDTGIPKTSEEVLEMLDYPEAKLLCRSARLSKQMGQIDGKNGWLKLEEDGYIHGRVKGVGARTHRMSHSGPNTANIDKELREGFLPDEGDVQVGVDAEGLELRLLAHLLHPYDNGRFIKVVTEGKSEDGTDPHTINQKAIILATRDAAKTVIYATIYGSGLSALGDTIKKDRREGDLPEGGSSLTVGKKAKKDLIKAIPGFGELLEKIKKLHESRKVVKWNKGVRREYSVFKAIDGRPIKNPFAYTGLNTILQSMGAIVMKVALVRFDEWKNTKGHNYNIKYLANVHDEFQLSVPKEHAQEVAEKLADCIREAGVELGIRCPLAGSYQIGKNWKETH